MTDSQRPEAPYRVVDTSRCDLCSTERAHHTPLSGPFAHEFVPEQPAEGLRDRVAAARVAAPSPLCCCGTAGHSEPGARCPHCMVHVSPAVQYDATKATDAERREVAARFSAPSPAVCEYCNEPLAGFHFCNNTFKAGAGGSDNRHAADKTMAAVPTGDGEASPTIASVPPLARWAAEVSNALRGLLFDAGKDGDAVDLANAEQALHLFLWAGAGEEIGDASVADKPPITATSPATVPPNGETELRRQEGPLAADAIAHTDQMLAAVYPPTDAGPPRVDVCERCGSANGDLYVLDGSKPNHAGGNCIPALQQDIVALRADSVEGIVLPGNVGAGVLSDGRDGVIQRVELPGHGFIGGTRVWVARRPEQKSELPASLPGQGGRP